MMAAESSGSGWEMAGIEIRFDGFTLDRQTRQLLRAGVEVPLSPKAFLLLDYLIEQRPAVVSKRDLLDHVWPDVAVEEQNVKNLVGEIRQALGDDARHPQFIRNAFGQGYAFCADVQAERSARRATVIAHLVAANVVHPLFAGENLIGRDSGCSIVLESEGVSRHHARIDASLQAIVVEDLGSKNGTWVNASRIESAHSLSPGDTIRIGRMTFSLRIAAYDHTETLSSF
jgi:DNA-binding winged helix-turn-helix (wHTH) protein